MFPEIKKTSPAKGYGKLLEDFFNTRFFNMTGRDISESLWPAVDVVEKKDRYILKADIPGMEKEDIRVNVDDNRVTVTGEKKQEEKNEEEDSFFHFERSYGSFSRSFILPSGADKQKIDAEYKNGVLEIIIPKSREKSGRGIEVK
ncbi:MAG: Hsp20/alpha crystallin family protein [Fibrobacterota bacterium]